MHIGNLTWSCRFGSEKWRSSIFELWSDIFLSNETGVLQKSWENDITSMVVWMLTRENHLRQSHHFAEGCQEFCHVLVFVYVRSGRSTPIISI